MASNEQRNDERKNQPQQQAEHRGGSGNFAENREKASEAGRKGGEHSQGGGQQGSGVQPGSQQQAEHRGGSGNFAENRDKASEAGRKGGEQSHGGGQQGGSHGDSQRGRS